MLLSVDFFKYSRNLLNERKNATLLYRKEVEKRPTVGIAKSAKKTNGKQYNTRLLSALAHTGAVKSQSHYHAESTCAYTYKLIVLLTGGGRVIAGNRKISRCPLSPSP